MISKGRLNSIVRFAGLMPWIAVLCVGFSVLPNAEAKKDKKKEKAQVQKVEEPKIDTSNLVWPAPPDIARILYLIELRGEKIEPVAPGKKKKKQGWMDRLAGVQEDTSKRGPQSHVLGKPYGVAVDSKGRIYVADTYVGAVFIFNSETTQVEFIRNGVEGRFKDIIGVAVDDTDRIFVSDAGLHQISVFDSNHKLEAVFGQDDLERPTGLAIDTENRFLYVVDTIKERVAVFDADTFKFLRAVGGPGKVSADDSPATFAKPTYVALDDDRNVYVADTINNRIQIFDADGNFISMFGKAGDGPGYFARPKGLAVDSDGHIWVADASQNRVQIFDREGHLLAFFGESGSYPGQFGLPTGLFIDKTNRVLVTEQLKGRVQVFRYITDAEAAPQKAEREKKNGTKEAAKSDVAPKS